MNIVEKNRVIEYLWLHSHFYGNKLYECEIYYDEEKGYTAVTLLFALLENVIKSVLNDYNSSFYNTLKELKNKCIITDIEYQFLNEDEFCIRKIRNLFAHANIANINLVNIESDREMLYPLTEESSCLLLYEKVSLVLFNIIMKIVSVDFLDSSKFDIILDDEIKKCNLKFIILSSKEMLALKGYPEDYLSDDLDIPEDAKIRLIDNSSDLNMLKAIFEELIHYSSAF
jgi:hypothetical protein